MKRKYIIIAFVIFSVVILLLPTQSITKTDLAHAMEGPTAAHIFGTDNLGRDVYSLMVRGYARTLTVVLVATAMSLAAGAALGLIAGYVGGIVEVVVQFVADFALIVPSFIAALVFSAVFGFSPMSIGMILGIVGIGEYVNQMMILTKRVKTQGYILGEHIVGLSPVRIIFRHILPNVSNSLMTFMANRAGSVIISYAGLAFIGLGTDATNPDWGSMIYQYRLFLVNSPYLIILPTLGILVLSLFFHIAFDNKEPERRSGIYE